MKLQTPFEIIHGKSKTFYITPFSVGKIQGIEKALLDEVADQDSLEYSELITTGVTINLIVVGQLPEEISALGCEVSVLRPDETWPERFNTEFSIDILIFSHGEPKHLTGRDKNRPNITYFFDGTRRYRSGINWFRSGRPCPLCTRNIASDSTPAQDIQLNRAVRLAIGKQALPQKGSITRWHQLNTIHCILEAIQLGQALINRDVHTMDSIRYTESLDITNGKRENEIFPLIPNAHT